MGTIIEYIGPLLKGESLSFEQAENLLDVIFEGGVPDAEVAAFLTAMRIKGATAQELAGLASSLRSHAVPVKAEVENLVDTCGTGGAAVKTFNISTAAALVAAGAGAYVAKHGNRGITSSCGSADVLAKLGVKIDCGAETVAQCIRQAHIGFMFAPMFHPAMKYVQPVRKSLGFGTVFNILGPLANPAGASAQVMGVADASLMGRIVETLKLLGVRRAMVVHSNGLDEISTSGVTQIAELKDGRIINKELKAADFGIVPADLKGLKICDAESSAKVLTDILTGREDGPAKDIVVLNAAAAIIVSGLADDFHPALDKAKASIASGSAMACLEKLIEISNKTCIS
jgi:anthranilate phosphoribosyltransferase